MLLAASSAAAGEPPSRERMAEFLRTARVVAARPAGKGATDTFRLTLDDGSLTHDASFQSIDERSSMKDLGGGRVEVDFVDSYRYNIAAFHFAELLGLDDMVPVSVERSWRAKIGALTWWVDDVLMDENELIERNLKAPDPVSWSEQIYKVRVFSQLVYDTDRNRGNLLITREWRLWMIDFTRAFRRWPKLRSAEGLERCERGLFERLKALTFPNMQASLGEHLTSAEIESLLARRDLIVEHYRKLIEARGESAVLY